MENIRKEEIWVRNTDTHIVQVLFAQLLVFHPVSDVCGPVDQRACLQNK